MTNRREETMTASAIAKTVTKTATKTMAGRLRSAGNGTISAARRVFTLHPAHLLVGAALLTLIATPACGPTPGGGGQDADTGDSGPDAQVWPDGHRPDVLEPDALVPACGNNVVEGDEACDDGNTVSGDGCNATCTARDDWDRMGPNRLDGQQNQPALACSDDAVALVWTDWAGLDGDGASVQMRLFGTDGMPQGDQSQVNVAWNGRQHQAKARWLPNGGLAVVWTKGTSESDVVLRICDSSGQRVTDDVPVASTSEGDQQTPALAVNEDGTILVVWADDSGTGTDQEGYAVFGRLFDSDGSPLTNTQNSDDSSFTINGIAAGVQRDPALCPTGDGGFLVVWTDGSGQLDQDGYGIAAVLVSSDGAVGEEFLVNSTTAGQQMAPAAALQPGLGPAVVWQDHSLTEDLQDFGIRARLLAADGSFRQNAGGTDSDFQVNSTTAGSQELPALAALPSGALLVVWQDWSGLDGSGSGIRARALAADGAPASFLYSNSGEDFQVDTTFVQSQTEPTVCSAAGAFFTAWTDESGHDPDSDTAVRMRAIVGW